MDLRIGAVGGLSLIVLGGDQLIGGAMNIVQRARGKKLPTGTLIQQSYRYTSQKITGKTNSGLEKALDSLYFGAEVVSACATGYLSVKASIVAVRGTVAIHTTRRLIVVDGYLS